MSVRSLALTAIALPLLLAACSSDDDAGIPVPGTPVPDPQGNQAGAGGTAAEGIGGEGNAEGGPDTDIPLEGGEPGATAAVEDPGTDCVVPALPEFAQLSDDATFPDPFTMLDGTAVTTQAQWVCRRAEISAQLQQYELGRKPSKPESVVGTAADGAITVQIGNGDRSISFTATIELPTSGTAPYPAMVGLGGVGLPRDIFLGQGVALITFPHEEIAAQAWGQGGVPNGTRGVGSYYDLYDGADNDGAMLAWAWGVSRLIDALETTPDAQVKADRVGITGCSRNGKGALMVGALDARIALTIPQESGSGGVAAWRASQEENTNPETRNHSAAVQTLETTYGEQPWFGAALNQFANNVNRLPLDHHEVVGMVAPRGFLALGNFNENWNWLGQYNANQGVAAGREIYRALGAEANIGYAESGHQHCGTDFQANEAAAVEAFVRKFLLDQADVSTDFFTVRYPLNTEKWVGWQTPTLQ